MLDVTVIGNAVLDVIARPLDRKVFETGSIPVDEIKLSFGGDALNESVILSQFGKRVELVSKIGQDEAGSRIINYLESKGVFVNKIRPDSKTNTSINIVLVDAHGERYFLTDPKGSQRKLSKDDVKASLQATGEIISFASMFVSPLLDIGAMADLFRTIKEETGAVLVADMTKAKNGETLGDLQRLLPYVDYMLPNEEEISLLTGVSDPCVNANLLVDAGVSCAIVKCGKNGSVIASKGSQYQVPAYHVEKCVDTTGAGDSFAAGFIWGLSERWSVFDSACFASAAASCAVEQTGAADGVQSLKEVLNRYGKVKEEALRINKSGQHDLL